MRTIQLAIITLFVTSLLALAGCEKTDGQVVLKEPRKAVSEMTPGMNWTVNGPVDELGNPIVLEQAE